MAAVAMMVTTTAWTAQPASAEARVDALLEAMGGRALWARTSAVHVDATHWDATIGAPFRNQIWNDFTAPKVRIEAHIGGQTRERELDGAAGSRRVGGETNPLTPEQVASEYAWWESNVYRTLHRLARRDPDLTVRASGANRIDIYRADGRRLNWLVLNSLGEPILFGTWDNETGTTFGPLTTSPGGLRHWRWGASADGTFRFEIKEIRALIPEP